MTLLKLTFAVALAVAIAGALWIRFAPVNAEAWHRVSGDRPAGTYDRPAGYEVRMVVSDGDTALRTAHELIADAPRTSILSGGPDEGLISYVSRTPVFGFPDVTVLHLDRSGDETLLVIKGRSIYGSYDWGANRRRIEGWLARLP